MIVSNVKKFSDENRGASVMEVLLAMAIVAAATPFVYTQVSKTNHTIRDIAVARKVISTRDNALNFVRMNQDKWPDTAQIRLDESELSAISPDAVAGLIDKYTVRGASITDVYLAFELGESGLRANTIARHIGGDAAIVDSDSVAYGNTWAVAAPDFMPGDLIYRISRDVSGVDTSRYLHRATSGEDGLNIMQRDLDMARHHVYNVATLAGKSARIKNGATSFVNATDVTAGTMYFSSGANIDGSDVSMGDIRVSGDMSGFRNVYADNINGSKFTTTGRIITDETSVLNTINISGNLNLKSDSARTISGFTGVTANSVMVPYIAAEEMIFYENFGLTVSGELLMSTTPPLRIGNWMFQSTKPPEFSKLTLSRGKIPIAPSRNDFSPLMRSGWTNGIQTKISTID